jgi:uncharacterized protein (DUF4415 family)
VTRDPRNPPQLTAEQIERLKALADLPDDQIDFSDIPELGPEDFKRALRGIYTTPQIRLDRRVYDWFRERAEHEEAVMFDINYVLLDYIAAEKKKAAKKAG